MPSFRATVEARTYAVADAYGALQDSVRDAANICGSDNSAIAYAIRWQGQTIDNNAVDLSNYKVLITYGGSYPGEIWCDASEGAVEVPGEFTIKLMTVSPLNTITPLVGRVFPGFDIRVNYSAAFGMQENRRLSLVAASDTPLGVGNAHNVDRVTRGYNRVTFRAGYPWVIAGVPSGRISLLAPPTDPGGIAASWKISSGETIFVPGQIRRIYPPENKYSTFIFGVV